MSKNKRGSSLAKKQVRPGELAVPVYKQAIPQPDGTTAVSFGISFDDIPIPERRYVADVGGVIFDGTVFQLLFGQRKIASTDLRSLVAVSVSPDAARRFVQTCETFLPETQQTIEKLGIKRPPLLALSAEPAQTVAVAANIIAAARAIAEASFDFYHTSAFSLHALKTREVLAVDPILRVDLPAGLQLAIIEELVNLMDRLPLEVQ